MGALQNILNNVVGKNIKIIATVETKQGQAGKWTGSGYEFNLLNDILKQHGAYLNIINKE